MMETSKKAAKRPLSMKFPSCPSVGATSVGRSASDLRRGARCETERTRYRIAEAAPTRRGPRARDPTRGPVRPRPRGPRAPGAAAAAPRAVRGDARAAWT